jgi:hypothetical protein
VGAVGGGDILTRPGAVAVDEEVRRLNAYGRRLLDESLAAPNLHASTEWYWLPLAPTTVAFQPGVLTVFSSFDDDRPKLCIDLERRLSATERSSARICLFENDTAVWDLREWDPSWPVAWNSAWPCDIHFLRRRLYNPASWVLGFIGT